jgi:hypothetical protein
MFSEMVDPIGLRFRVLKIFVLDDFAMFKFPIETMYFENEKIDDFLFCRRPH